MKTKLAAYPKPKDAPRRRTKNHMRSKATLKLARMKRDLDRQVKAEVFARDEQKCIMCGASHRELQPAHVLSRRHPCLRWNPENLMSLCGGCHLYWHHEPAMAIEWFLKNFRERWDRIKLILLANPKVNVRELWRERCGAMLAEEVKDDYIFASGNYAKTS